MTTYSIENVSQLAKKIKGNRDENAFPFNYWNKKKLDLQVHTKGKMYEKTMTVFKNEEPSASHFVMETYEPITKSSIWKGIDNISRIFKNTGFDITTDAKTSRFIAQSDIKEKIIDNFVNGSMSSDPNIFAVPYMGDQENWEIRFIESHLITSIDKESISFIDETHSTFEIELAYYPFLRKNHQNTYKADCLLSSYPKKIFSQNKIRYIYISREQYIIIDFKGEVFTATFHTLARGTYPYIATGVNKEFGFVSESPVSPFVPFGNISLLQHRAARSVENIFGYPRMSEMELPCDHCHQGKEKCEITEDYPLGERECTKCHGTGSLSLQSIFKIYKRKLSEDPALNADIDPVKFHTPDVGILEYISQSWKDTLRLGEDAIYVQQIVETGNVQSAKSREKQLEQMYSWLDRLSNFFYNSASRIINNVCLLNGYGHVSIEKPISFAIMNELESFEYLNMIVNSNSPIFIKTVHIENFLKKYISSSNPIIRVVDLLKKVDVFCFYSMDDLQKMSNSGVIDDKQWKIHAYAFPLLNQMYALNPELFLQDDNEIIKELEVRLGAVILSSNAVLL
ncbi:hypothetical protein [Chryseobacterium potabilaquae]|uniref:Uncharacterized protein n=1 Tax=Chryseobacterium potabilaquae TaxID=2675057 RepID=A0A6N4XAK2_9FLAO|nr:hypothetical protein [Chryseobacterium potabilaquae]CAA7196742.1 hypothetical protein CHRY9293_02817 [Chryseobacterium potabilaquae]